MARRVPIIRLHKEGNVSTTPLSNDINAQCVNFDRDIYTALILTDIYPQVDVEGVMNPLRFGAHGGTAFNNYQVVNLMTREWIVVRKTPKQCFTNDI